MVVSFSWARERERVWEWEWERVRERGTDLEREGEKAKQSPSKNTDQFTKTLWVPWLLLKLNCRSLRHLELPWVSLGDIVGQKQSKEETPQQPQPTCSTACCSSPGSPGCSSLLRLSRDRLASQLQIALANSEAQQNTQGCEDYIVQWHVKTFQG